MNKKIVQNLAVEMHSFLTEWKISVSGLCADFSEIPCLSNNSSENSHNGLDLVQLVTMIILPQRIQDTGLTRLSSQKYPKEPEVHFVIVIFFLHCLVETTLYSLQRHIPARKI
jgi:hypothetical protein